MGPQDIGQLEKAIHILQHGIIEAEESKFDNDGDESD